MSLEFVGQLRTECPTSFAYENNGAIAAVIDTLGAAYAESSDLDDTCAREVLLKAVKTVMAMHDNTNSARCLVDEVFYAVAVTLMKLAAPSRRTLLESVLYFNPYRFEQTRQLPVVNIRPQNWIHMGPVSS